MSRLFSIGHSNHEFAKLVQLLQAAEISAVADVRSSPFSQRYPQFNRPELEAGLNSVEIAYAFLGDLLGGRPRQPSLYDEDGRVNYERVRATDFFRAGLDRLVRGTDDFRVVMLCAEEDPLDCHRGLMIAPALAEMQILPDHIRGNGSCESMAEMEARLLAETRVGAGILDGLFASMVTGEDRQRFLAEAYRMMSRRKAFRLRPDAEEAF
jgi:uncharacterized protein (DUF488 family)